MALAVLLARPVGADAESLNPAVPVVLPRRVVRWSGVVRLPDYGGDARIAGGRAGRKDPQALAI